MSRGILFVLSAPSGGGKTTILKKVMADLPGLVFSVSHTTRKPRLGEEDGRDYYFVSRQEFASIRDRRPPGFLEWAEVHGNWYGTSRAAVEQCLCGGRDVVLDIDVQGATQIREGTDSVTVFIAPPSLAELAARLRGRGTEDEHTLALRLENAKQELAFMERYDYLVVNDRLAEAVESLRSIIIAERCRQRRAVDGVPVQVDF